MSKIITFSRNFPAYHPRKGQPTHFVEKVLTSLGIDYTGHEYFIWLCENNKGISERFLDGFFGTLSHDVLPKVHTIRNHKIPLRVGDFINPKCWAGSHLTPPVRPYHKTPDGYWQIKFAPDIEVKKVWVLEITPQDGLIMPTAKATTTIGDIAKNDGLELEDFKAWFKDFKEPGIYQIICWNENVNY